MTSVFEDDLFARFDDPLARKQLAILRTPLVDTLIENTKREARRELLEELIADWQYDVSYGGDDDYDCGYSEGHNAAMDYVVSSLKSRLEAK